MSFGQKPTAWARPQGAPQQQQINPNLFTNQLGLAATGQAFSAIPGMSLNSGLAGLVNQAAFTNTMNMSTMNSMLAQAHRSQMMPPQQHIQQQPQHQAVQQQHQQATSPTRSQRTFIGVVTKLMETYGFVDEDVFFQTNVIRGSLPRRRPRHGRGQLQPVHALQVERLSHPAHSGQRSGPASAEQTASAATAERGERSESLEWSRCGA